MFVNLEILHAFLSSADFFQNQFKKNPFWNTVRVSNSFPTFVGPDLGPNCLLKLSADDTSSSRLRVNES